MDDVENLNTARIGLVEDQVSFKSGADAKRASCQKPGVRYITKPSHLLLYGEMTKGLLNLRVAVRPRANNVSKIHTVPVFLLCRSMSCARFFSQ